MIKVVSALVTVALTSLFFFPFFFSFLPMINTKMFLAVFGLMFFFMDHLNGKTDIFEKGLFNISMWALGVSFFSFLSMTLNNTPDDSYLTYIVSMLVWLFAAYACVYLMRQVHGHISLEIVGYYLVGVALLQCTLALMINYFPFVKSLVDTYVTGEKYMGVGVKERLYGVGCALDVGGGRLGAVLVILAHLMLLTMKRRESLWKFVGQTGAFIYILVVGNMMGRTATVGAVIASAYFLFVLLSDRNLHEHHIKSYLNVGLWVFLGGGLISVGLYNLNPEFRKLLRFAFEAFFNYFELGKFETNSTNMLSEGIIFPDNWRTWIIGDGYMASGANDPYYIGPSDYGFYMNTDAGYSRFIFYFGVIGLTAFSLFFIMVCKECMYRFKEARYLFIAILLFNFCVWIKVSTDMFVVFAPFLCINALCANEGVD